MNYIRSNTNTEVYAWSPNMNISSAHRQTASVHLKEIRKFLPVVGDGKAAAMLLCLNQQIGHQLFFRGTFGYDLNFLI